MKLTAREGKLFFADKEVDTETIRQILDPLLSDERRERIEDALSGRTLDVATVVEGSINTGNVSAVMRTAEAFGFLPFHVIRSGGKYKNSARTSQGSEKWLDLHYWDRTSVCLEELRKSGYRIVATVPDREAVPLDQIMFDRPTALVFGNEASGVSATVSEMADLVAQIPMTGFVESFNISVAAAICLYQAYASRLQSGDVGMPSDRLELWRVLYYYRSVRRPDDVIQRSLNS